MVGLGFTILSETPCADPHAGCCGDWGLDTPGYPILRRLERHIGLPSSLYIAGYGIFSFLNSHRVSPKTMDCRLRVNDEFWVRIKLK